MPNAFLSGLTQGLGSSLSTVFEEREAQRRQSAIEERQKRLDERQEEIDERAAQLGFGKRLSDILGEDDPDIRQLQWDLQSEEILSGLGATKDQEKAIRKFFIEAEPEARVRGQQFIAAQFPGTSRAEAEAFMEVPGREQFSEDQLTGSFERGIMVEAGRAGDSIRSAAQGQGQEAELNADIAALEATIGIIARKLGSDKVPAGLRTALREGITRRDTLAKDAEPEDETFVQMWPPGGGGLAKPRVVVAGSEEQKALIKGGYLLEKPTAEGGFVVFYPPPRASGLDPITVRQNSPRATALATQGWTTAKPVAPVRKADFINLYEIDTGTMRSIRADSDLADMMTEGGKWIEVPIQAQGTPEELGLTPAQQGELIQREIRLAFEIGELSSLSTRGAELGLGGLTGFRGPAAQLLGGMFGQVSSALGQAVTAGISGVSGTDLAAWKLRARAVVTQQIPLMVGEESGRITDVELRLTDKYTRINAVTADDDQVTGALSALSALKILDLQETQLKLGREPVFDVWDVDPAKSDDKFDKAFQVLSNMFPAFDADMIGRLVAELETRQHMSHLLLSTGG